MSDMSNKCLHSRSMQPPGEIQIFLGDVNCFFASECSALLACLAFNRIQYKFKAVVESVKKRRRSPTISMLMDRNLPSNASSTESLALPLIRVTDDRRSL